MKVVLTAVMWAFMFALPRLDGARAGIYTPEGRECNDICDKYDKEDVLFESGPGEYWQSLDPNNSCDRGKIHEKLDGDLMRRLNLIRYISNLDPVFRDSSSSPVEEVQTAAKYIDSNNCPVKHRSDCANCQECCDGGTGTPLELGLGTSNLAEGYHQPQNTIWGYMREFETPHLCHRRPLLDHRMRCTTTGQYGMASVMKYRAFKTNVSCSVPQPNVPTFSAWPPPGDVPEGMLYGTRIWHFSRVHPAIPWEKVAEINKPTVKITDTVTCADVPVSVIYNGDGKSGCGENNMVRFSGVGYADPPHDDKPCDDPNPKKGCAPAYVINHPLLIEVTYPDGQYYSYTTRIVDCSKPKAERCPAAPSPASCSCGIPSVAGTCNQAIPILAENDDAEQKVNSNNVNCESSDLELVRDTDDQVVGLRFRNVEVDSSTLSRVKRARISFTNDDSESTTHRKETNLDFRGHDTDDSPGFCSNNNPDIRSRTKTSASVAWNKVPTFTGSNHYFSPDLKSIMQEVVSRDGWKKGNAMTFIISGEGNEGKRVVDSFGKECAPTLYIEADCAAVAPPPPPSAAPPPPPPPPASKCASPFDNSNCLVPDRAEKGCDCECVQECVCARDAFCCDTDWDPNCVSRVTTFGCYETCNIPKTETAVVNVTFPGCVPKTCADFKGRCGAFPDGCGGITLPCTCANQFDTCSLTSTCQTCTPRTCEDLGATCGTHSDGCGGQLSCGSCDSSSEYCFDGRSCQPNGCTPSQTCQVGQCGTLLVPCIGSAANTSVSCGGCAGRADCTAADPSTQAGTCECIPTQTCGTRTCGTINDGCGNIVSCGTCPDVNAPCKSSTLTCGKIDCGENQVLQAGACVCAPGYAADSKSFECVDASSMTSGSAAAQGATAAAPIIFAVLCLGALLSLV